MILHGYRNRIRSPLVLPWNINFCIFEHSHWFYPGLRPLRKQCCVCGGGGSDPSLVKGVKQLRGESLSNQVYI